MTKDSREPSNGSSRRDDSDRPETGLSAEERLNALTAKKPEEKASGQGPESGQKKPLTEKQRIEARRARQARRRRKPVEGNPLSKGLRTVGFEVRRTASFLGSSVVAALAALGPVFSAAGMGLVWLIEQAGKGLRAFWKLIVRLTALAGRVVVAADRVVTPHRALILVGAVAAVILGISQFKGLGSIEIGQAGYSGIEDLARAPAIDKTTPAGVHTRILVPIAAIAFFAVVVIALGSVGSMARRLARFRRFSSMVLLAIGLLTLVVTLLIDLPDATDTTEAALSYSGVQARILGGFWLELAAGATLAVSGLALLLEPSLGQARDRQRQSRKSESRERPDEERRLERERRQARRQGSDATISGAVHGGSA